MSGLRRVDQDMAREATRILPREISGDLRTRYRQLPIMIRMSGLAATTAYLVSKAGHSAVGGTALERAYHELVSGIRKRLVEAKYDLGWGGGPGSNEGLVAALANLPPAEYARASAEVEALAGWLSRLAEARHKAQPSAGDQ